MRPCCSLVFAEEGRDFYGDRDDITSTNVFIVRWKRQ